MGSLEDKARKARNKANESFSGVSRSKTEKIVKGIAKTAGKKLEVDEVNRAADMMQTRRNNDRRRTAARATFIAGPKSPVAKRAAASRMEAATGGPAKKREIKPTAATAKFNAATKAANAAKKAAAKKKK